MTDQSRPKIDTAMVLAAGLATRMRPLSNDRPKCLIEVAGRTLIDRILDRFADAGVDRVTVNTHYLADQLERHLAERERPSIAISREDVLLGTGGGIRQALDHLGPGPFYVANSDIFWVDGYQPALRRMAAQWDDDTMDALLLLVPTIYGLGIGDCGDFRLAPSGRIYWPQERLVAPFAYGGIQLIHPRLLDGMPDGPFQMAPCWQRAEAEGRLWGIAHDDVWAHVGTPRALTQVTRLLAGYDFRWVAHGP